MAVYSMRKCSSCQQNTLVIVSIGMCQDCAEAECVTCTADSCDGCPINAALYEQPEEQLHSNGAIEEMLDYERAWASNYFVAA